MDKLTSDYPSDAASIMIGLSDHDSSSCSVCSVGGIYYENGCKKCLQDGVIFGLKAIENNPAFIGWSNDNFIYGGDDSCTGVQYFKNFIPESKKQYKLELSKINNKINSKIFSYENLEKNIDEIEFNLCSDISELKFLRFSNEDGKDIGNGGMIIGNIDEVKIFDQAVDENNSSIIFSENFDNCSEKTCDGLITLQNPSMFFNDEKSKNFHFTSILSGTNDYSHIELDNILPDDWKLTLNLSIDQITLHPQGKGILQLDPHLRNLIFGSLILILIILGILFLILNRNY